MATVKHPFLPDRFETLADAERARDEIVAAMKRSGLPGAGDLASRLELCTPSTLCGSGASPFDLRRYRERAFRGMYRDLFHECPIVLASIVPRGLRFPRGSLNEFELERFRKRVQRNFERKLPTNVWALAGVDFSVNVSEADGVYFQPHLAVLAAFRPDAEIDWSTLIPPDRRDPRPTWSKLVDDPADYPTVFSYLLKARFYRRSRYRARNGRMNTRAFNLKPPELVELSLFLDRYPIRARLIAHRMRISEGRDRLHFQLADDGPR